MRQAQIGVYHQGCWGSSTTEKYPHISMKELGPVRILKKNKKSVNVQATWKVVSENKKELDEYIDYIKKVKSIKKVTMIGKEGSYAIITTRWNSPSSSYDIVMKNKCAYTSPVVQEGGYETYSIIAEKPKEITKLMNELKQIGEVKMFKVGKYNGEDLPLDISEKQLQALRTAILHNYYSWPRKATLSSLSKAANQKRTTFQENLRKAEAKVLPKLIKKFVDLDDF